MNIKIISNIDEIDQKRWSQFVYDHPQGAVFQSPEYFNLFKDYKNYIPLLIACLDQDRICGVLLAVILREYSGLAGKLTARAIVTGGPLFAEGDDALLDRMLETYDRELKNKAIYTQFRNLHNISRSRHTFESQGYIYEDHLNYLFDLNLGQDVIWAGMHPTRKKQIERGYRRGLRCEIGSELTEANLEKLYDILLGVYRHARLPLPDFSFFMSAFDQLYTKSILKIFIARHNEDLVGSRWVLCYKDTIFDWYAGCRHQYYDKYPNDILPWEIMKWGIENGYKRFDFGGAGKPDKSYGVRDYKEKFGGELVNFGRWQKVYQPLLMKIAENGFKVWRVFKK